MLSQQTRREVRGPFAISFIQDKVKGAQEKYVALLGKVEEKHGRLCARFATALNDVRHGSNLHKDYLVVLNAFEGLRSDLMSGFRGHCLKSYAETLNFLEVVSTQAKTIMLAQSEFLALEKDDSALRALQAADESLSRTEKKIASYGF